MHHSSLTNIDLNLLVILRALLAERHVARAAAKLSLSPSATSHALARLRELYHDDLLVRSGRALLPTTRALQILPLLERGLLDLHQSVLGGDAFEPATAEQMFSVAVGDYGQALLLGPLLGRLRTTAPHIDLAIVQAINTDEIVTGNELDLAIVPLFRPLPNAWTSQELFAERFICMVRKRHPTIHARLTLKEYTTAGHVVVAPSGASGSIVDTELERRGLTRRVALRIPNFLVAPVVIAESDWINTGPERLSVNMAKRYAIKLLPPPIGLPVFSMHLVWHKRFDRDPAHAWLRGQIVEVAKHL